jgi:hypothetical protein
MPNDHKMSTKWTVQMFANDNDVQKSNPQSMTNRMALKKDEGKRSKLMCIYIIIYIYKLNKSLVSAPSGRLQAARASMALIGKISLLRLSH